MSEAVALPEVSPMLARAALSRAVIGSPEPVCAICGGSLDPRKRAACSAKCRAALSRRRRKDAQRNRDEDIRALLETALKKLEEGAP
jgi:predicted nucleic acid-binding Zn ribbon protein